MNGALRAKKSLGQHWLTDQASLEAICSSAELSTNDTVLEIGPGTGTLTSHLVKQAKQVIAVEYDESLVKKLSSQQIAKNLQIVEGDILKFDFSSLPTGYKVVANIPYYLTSNLLRVLSETPNQAKLVVLLIQKEVARRIAAGPGQMSLLSVSAQFYWETSLGIEVPARLFRPPPKVDSQVIILSRYPKPLFPDVQANEFFQVVKAGFASRRKTLLNSLSGGLRLSKDEVSELLEASNITPNTRPQMLSMDEWHSLHINLKNR